MVVQFLQATKSYFKIVTDTQECQDKGGKALSRLESAEAVITTLNPFTIT